MITGTFTRAGDCRLAFRILTCEGVSYWRDFPVKVEGEMKGLGSR